ncbi:MAG: DUF4430 domain-containing protein [Candidatus Hodarchaeota archaeon]
MKKNLLLIGLFIFIMAIGAIIFYSTLQNNGFEEDTISSSNHMSKPKSASIPSNYSQDLGLDGVYIYNVTDFGGPTGYYNFTPWPAPSFEGNWEAKTGGQIKINFTGFYNENPLWWGDIYYDSIPWMDIEIMKNDSGVLVSNFTLTNRSNTEISYNLILGYSSFQPGFLIPIDNLTNIKKIAIEEAPKGYFSGQSIVEESFHFLHIDYENIGGTTTNLLYDKSTGLLVWAKLSLGGYQMEIKSLNLTYNLDLTYNYTVSEYGEPLKWFNLSGDFRGNVNTNVTGIVRVNFTGNYDKEVNDESIFDNPIPWINIAFIENNTGILNTNFTLSNISNSEAAINLQLGFNNFSSGFLIPTDNITSLINNATNEYLRNPSNCLIFIAEETGLTVKFIFIETGGVNFTSIIYDKFTGLLMSMRTVSGDFLLDMEIVLYYEESDTVPPPNPYSKTVYDTEEEKGDREFANFIVPFLLLGFGAGASIGLLIWKKDIKTLKYLFTGILGSLCFSSLIFFNYWLTTGIASTDETETPSEVVEHITLIVEFADDNIKRWEDFTLYGGKTTVLDALDKYCDIEYDDYGWGVLVTEIDGIEGDWLYEVNGEKPSHGADKHYLRDGDEIKWVLQ